MIRCSSYNTVMCDILKPPEQVPTSQAAQSPNADLVSAGAVATASVAAIMETRPYAESSQQAARENTTDFS